MPATVHAIYILCTKQSCDVDNSWLNTPYITWNTNADKNQQDVD